MPTNASMTKPDAVPAGAGRKDQVVDRMAADALLDGATMQVLLIDRGKRCKY